MSEAKLSPAFPQLPTGDIDKTASFFSEKLGFEVFGIYNDKKFLIMRRGVTEIHFWKAENEEEALKAGGVSSCYVRVENITPLFNEFKERGVKFRYELTLQPWGMKEMQIDDPYSNAIRFGEPI